VQSLESKQGKRRNKYSPNDETSKLDIRIIKDLVSKLHNLQEIGCELDGNEFCFKYFGASQGLSHCIQDCEGPRRDTWHNFATAIANTNFPLSLELAQLNFVSGYSDEGRKPDQRQEMPNMVSPSESDPFNAALCTFSRSL
jgi:hypothetical protein